MKKINFTWLERLAKDKQSSLLSLFATEVLWVFLNCMAPKQSVAPKFDRGSFKIPDIIEHPSNNYLFDNKARLF
jgi:hypothetical protein